MLKRTPSILVDWSEDWTPPGKHPVGTENQPYVTMKSSFFIYRENTVIVELSSLHDTMCYKETRRGLK